ncbi:hypothetical protein MNBD_GAMMA26-2181 [hydrothermal vent metagenome]|uniref:PpiC domain-containing protein n=1 Tax=hydrothermal vent metagenome TaxID=652676 RepID=A0A3B1ASG9_9ZZZZ
MNLALKLLLITLTGLLLAACSEEPPATTQQVQVAEEQATPVSAPAPDQVPTAAPTPTPDAIKVPEKKPSLDDPDVMVIVNGTPVSKAMYAVFFQQWSHARQGATGETSDEQVAILNELINAMLLTQEAEANGFDKRPEVAALLTLLRTRALTEMSVANYVQQRQITEHELRELYDKHVNNLPREEFKARHILLDTEEDAIAVITELTGGVDFIELAKTHSTGPSAPQGGDLGWFSATQMVRPFANAIIALQNGSHSTAPVKTEFGWHVILREESRNASPPTFAEVQDQILEAKQREVVVAYVKELRDKADIQLRPPATAPTEQAPAE